MGRTFLVQALCAALLLSTGFAIRTVHEQQTKCAVQAGDPRDLGAVQKYMWAWNGNGYDTLLGTLAPDARIEVLDTLLAGTDRFGRTKAYPNEDMTIAQYFESEPVIKGYTKEIRSP